VIHYRSDLKKFIKIIEKLNKNFKHIIIINNSIIGSATRQQLPTDETVLLRLVSESNITRDKYIRFPRETFKNFVCFSEPNEQEHRRRG